MHQERRRIVFIDESGLSERPHRVRTWAPRGQTPVLQYHFHWKPLSAIAGITVWRFYFRLYEGTVRKEEIVAFLRHLRRHVCGKLLIIWDRLNQHRSRLVKDYVASQRGAIELECLPAYAPELNPVEYIWGYWKKHELPNLCARDLVELGSAGRAALSSHAPSTGSGRILLEISRTVTVICNCQ